MKAKKEPVVELVPVYGSSYCRYSTLECNQEALYKNQESLLYVLNLILEEVRK